MDSTRRLIISRVAELGLSLSELPSALERITRISSNSSKEGVPSCCTKKFAAG